MAILQDTENPNHTSKFLKKTKEKKTFTTPNSIYFLTPSLCIFQSDLFLPH